MNNNDEDNIRSPDPVKIEQLINYDFDTINHINHINHINPIWNNNTNYDLNTILEISKHEFDSIQQQEETKTIELICNQSKQQEYEERQNKFNNVKIQLNKIILFDKPNLYYYELVLTIIEMYEFGALSEYKTNINDYTKIFNILKTIRIPTDEFDNLKKLIIYE